MTYHGLQLYSGSRWSSCGGCSCRSAAGWGASCSGKCGSTAVGMYSHKVKIMTYHGLQLF